MRFITFSLVVCLAATLAVAATTTTTTTTTTTSAADDGPRHVHFAYGADTSSSLKVSWQLTKYDPTINQALVKYGVSSGSYPFVLDGYNVTFSTYNATAAGYFLQVTLTKLTPATTYYIVVGDTATMKYSKEFAIKTLPSILDPNTGGVSIAIYGDLGIKNSDHVVPRLIQLSDANAVDFFMHVG